MTIHGQCMFLKLKNGEAVQVGQPLPANYFGPLPPSYVPVVLAIFYHAADAFEPEGYEVIVHHPDVVGPMLAAINNKVEGEDPQAAADRWRSANDSIVQKFLKDTPTGQPPKFPKGQRLTVLKEDVRFPMFTMSFQESMDQLVKRRSFIEDAIRQGSEGGDDEEEEETPEAESSSGSAGTTPAQSQPGVAPPGMMD